MANKLYLDKKDYDVPYEPSASEDEYSEEEKQILKEVREGNKRRIDQKQEILAFDESDEDGDGNDDIIGDSDIERGDDDDGIPDSRAWGKQRRAYYNTDFVDQDYSAYNEQEEEQAQQEEEEAKAIQLRLAKQLDEADFFVDLPTGAADSDDEVGTKIKSKDGKTEEKIKFDLSGMSQRQKLQLFEKDSPEFAGLVSDFQTHLSESQALLNPILEFAKEKELNLPIFEFVRTKNNMILTYCSNIVFYLLLKVKRIQIKNHPVTKRLVQLRKLLIQLQQKYDDVVKPQLESLLERINSGEEIHIDLRPPEKKPTKKLRMMNAFSDDEGESDEEYEDAPTAKRAKLSDEEGASSNEEAGEDDDETIDKEEAERRGITYQIAKNKGLTPHRKKELRNPRVKHRSKFRKALIRRKGAVRTVRKETTRYGGEVSGIKATVKKGIKIKS